MKKLLFVTIFVFLAGCLPFNAPEPQPEIPGLVETIVAATFADIVSQTAAVLPPKTATPTKTGTPTNTLPPPTITPTYTPTFIFILSTWTPSKTSTPTLTATPDVTATPTDFACQFVSQTPSNGTTMNPRNGFDWLWTVTNTGVNDWLTADVQSVYVSGDELHKKASYALPNDVLVGESVGLGVDMEAPKTPGSYSTTWALKKGGQTFCTRTLNIIVK